MTVSAGVTSNLLPRMSRPQGKHLIGYIEDFSQRSCPDPSKLSSALGGAKGFRGRWSDRLAVFPKDIRSELSSSVCVQIRFLLLLIRTCATLVLPGRRIGLRWKPTRAPSQPPRSNGRPVRDHSLRPSRRTPFGLGAKAINSGGSGGRAPGNGGLRPAFAVSFRPGNNCVPGTNLTAVR